MSDNVIFVFGSNLAGRHGKGAALYAAKNHNAKRGVGEGLTGTAYAIPTKDYNMRILPFYQIDAAICRFLNFARVRSDLTFILTPVATGLAGYSKRDVWSVLRREGLTPNVYLAHTWVSE